MRRKKNKDKTINNEAATIESAGIHPDIHMTDISLDNRREKKGVFKKLLLIPALGCLLGVVVYIAGVVYYKSHFFNGTNVYGTDVSKMEVEDFEEGLSEYSLKIIQKDKMVEYLRKNFLVKTLV